MKKGFLILLILIFALTGCKGWKKVTQLNDTVDKTIIDSSSTVEVTHSEKVDTVVVVDGSKETAVDLVTDLTDSTKTVIDNQDVTVTLHIDTVRGTIKTVAKVKPRKQRVQIEKKTTVKSDTDYEAKIVHRDNSVRKETEKPPSKGNDNKRWSGFKFGVFVTALVAILLAVFRPPFVQWIFALFRRRKE